MVACCAAGPSRATRRPGSTASSIAPGGADSIPPLGVLRKLALEAARAAPPRPACIVPVPLHPRRLRERGFNPAAVLAR